MVVCFQVWTWGKGDYFRLGIGADHHVRKPTLVEGLKGEKVIDVAVGALHCLAVTDAGTVNIKSFKNFSYLVLELKKKTITLYPFLGLQLGRQRSWSAGKRYNIS